MRVSVCLCACVYIFLLLNSLVNKICQKISRHKIQIHQNLWAGQAEASLRTSLCELFIYKFVSARQLCRAVAYVRYVVAPAG